MTLKVSVFQLLGTKRGERTVKCSELNGIKPLVTELRLLGTSS